MQRRPRPFRPTWSAIRSFPFTPALFGTTARSDGPGRRIRADGNALAQWISLTNGVTDMVLVLDTTASAPRHPEKAHRQDTAALRKPDWIRVKAPGSSTYAET